MFFVVVFLQLIFFLVDMQFWTSFYYLEISTLYLWHIGSTCMSAEAKFMLRSSQTTIWPYICMNVPLKHYRRIFITWDHNNSIKTYIIIETKYASSWFHQHMYMFLISIWQVSDEYFCLLFRVFKFLFLSYLNFHVLQRFLHSIVALISQWPSKTSSK